MRIFVVCCLVSITGCVDTTEDCGNTPGDAFAKSIDADVPEYVDALPPSPTPLGIAVGGTQRYEVDVDGCNDRTRTSNVRATSGNERIATTSSVYTAFDVVGVAPGEVFVEFSGAGGGDGFMVSVGPIDHVAFLAPEVGEPGAFYTGTPFAMIALLNPLGARLVDRNVSVVTGAFQLGDKWDHLAIGNAAPGDYSLAIEAGNRAWPADITIVDHITDVTPLEDHVTAMANAGAEACFLAHLGSVVVAGVPWQFDYPAGHGKIDPKRANCVLVQAGTGSQQKLMQTVTAHALGFTATVDVTLVP